MCHHPPTSCLLLRGYWWANGNGSRNHISPLFMKTEKWAINSIQRQEEMEIGAQNRRPWIRAGKSNADNNKYRYKTEKITTFLQLISTVGATCGFSRAPFLPFVSTYRHTCVSLSFSLSGGFFLSLFHAATIRWQEKSICFLYGIFQLGVWGSGGWIGPSKELSKKNEHCWVRPAHLAWNIETNNYGKTASDECIVWN